ncbi:hypothetical protein V865_005658 [Kwoniella europaea PYCC6329]|uniref:Leucine-rich repeat-containing protein n=1 Tax=Kwoniella europaea PYCC6329 TaxID=1423913 RepID=A0AAX4KMG0_9TREE
MGIQARGLYQDDSPSSRSDSDSDDPPLVPISDDENSHDLQDDFDESSSDQEEPMSSSSSSSSSPDGSESDDIIYEHFEDEGRTPRRIVRRKEQIVDCLECLGLILDKRGGVDLIERDLRIIEEKRSKVSLRLLNLNGNGIRMKGTGKGRSKMKMRNQKKVNPSSKMDTPWTRFVDLIRMMRVDGSAEKDPKEIRYCLGALHHLIQQDILPLIQDRHYIHTLAGIESRTIRSLRSGNINLPEGFQLISSDPSHLHLISQTPLFFLLRLIRYTLNPDQIKPNLLDLSNLPYDNVNPFLQEVDFEGLFQLIGSSIEEVRYLDLSGNKMENEGRWGLNQNQSNFPIFQSSLSLPLTFPNIEIINLRNTPNLTNLPLSMVRLPKLRRIIANRHSPIWWVSEDSAILLRYNAGDQKQLEMRLNSTILTRHTDIASDNQETGGRAGVSSLVDHCILSLLQLKYSTPNLEEMESYEKIVEEMIPERYLGQYKYSYRCDRCCKFKIIHNNDAKSGNETSVPEEFGWMMNDPHLPYTAGDRNRVTLKPVRVVGRCCGICKIQVARLGQVYRVNEI